MVPFNSIAFSRYAVYFRHYPFPEQYQNEVAALTKKLAEEQRLEAETVDRVLVGHEDSEHSHGLEAVFSYTGGEAPVRWRDAREGGYFMYNLKVLPHTPQKLYMVYSADDEGARIFDVMVDGKVLQTLDHSTKLAGKSGELYPVSIDLPAALIADRDHLTVKFQARRGNTAGGLFDLRVTRKAVR